MLEILNHLYNIWWISHVAKFQANTPFQCSWTIILKIERRKKVDTLYFGHLGQNNPHAFVMIKLEKKISYLIFSVAYAPNISDICIHSIEYRMAMIFRMNTPIHKCDWTKMVTHKLNSKCCWSINSVA